MYPMIRADYWVARKLRAHFVETTKDDPEYLATKDFGEALAHLAERGHSSARLLSATSDWDITFKRAVPPSDNDKENDHGQD